MKKLFLMFCLFFISNCASIDNHFAELRAERENYRKNLCINKGYNQNTDTFRLCLQNLKLQSQVNEANRKARNSNSKVYMMRQQCNIDGGVMIGNTCDKD